MDSGQHAEEKKPKALRAIISIVIMIVAVLVLSVALRTFVFQPYQVPSSSMETTIMTDDMLFSEKVSYYFRQPEQGDIVTFDDPIVPSRTLVKRVIAVGGQTVNLVDGKVVVDGIELDEPYTNGKESYPLSSQASGVTVKFPYTVPEGYIWVMGDNRTNSQDSRYFGAIPVSSVTGHAALIYWPLNHFGGI